MLSHFINIAIAAACSFVLPGSGKTYPDTVMIASPLGDTVKSLGSSIMVVYQDKKHVYWFGSWETGLYRYDGRTIINYQKEHGLFSNRIDEIKEDASGNMYFSSCYPVSGITKYDGQRFTRLTAEPSDEWGLQEGDLWFKHAYQAEKVYRYDGQRLLELQIPKPPALPNPFEVYSIYRDSQGSIWFGTNPSGVCRYNGATFDWITEADVTEFGSGGANGVRAIAEDRDGRFWFNTEYRYRVYGGTKKNSGTFYSREKGIGSLDGKANGSLVEYLSILKDRSGNMWIATYRNGIWKYDGSKLIHYPVQVDGKNITVFSIYEDRNGGLWLGTHGNGAFRFEGKGFEKFER